MAAFIDNFSFLINININIIINVPCNEIERTCDLGGSGVLPLDFDSH